MSSFGPLCVQSCMSNTQIRLKMCPYWKGVLISEGVMCIRGPENASVLERCPHFRGCCVQASMELGPEIVSVLDGCLHFSVVELGTENLFLLERGILYIRQEISA